MRLFICLMAAVLIVLGVLYFVGGERLAFVLPHDASSTPPPARVVVQRPQLPEPPAVAVAPTNEPGMPALPATTVVATAPARDEACGPAAVDPLAAYRAAYQAFDGEAERLLTELAGKIPGRQVADLRSTWKLLSRRALLLDIEQAAAESQLSPAAGEVFAKGLPVLRQHLQAMEQALADLALAKPLDE